MLHSLPMLFQICVATLFLMWLFTMIGLQLYQSESLHLAYLPMPPAKVASSYCLAGVPLFCCIDTLPSSAIATHLTSTLQCLQAPCNKTALSWVPAVSRCPSLLLEPPHQQATLLP